MQVRPEQLTRELAKGLARCYLITGEEPLLQQECGDAIRQVARAKGCTEREVIDIGPKGEQWQTLLQSAGALSLFADKKLIEVRLPSGKPGAEGSKALQEYLQLESDDVLLIIAGKIDRQSQRAKWYTALDQCGVVVTLWPIRPSELPQWLHQRLAAAGLKADRDALEMIAERVEGNLLAAAQEVEKLKLLANTQHVTVSTVLEAVADSARYNPFSLVDTALSGDARGAVRSLRGLEAEGNAPPTVLWAVAREARLLLLLDEQCRGGMALNQAMQQQGVWKNRMGLVQAALKRHDSDSLGRLQSLAFNTDAAIKGLHRDQPWDLLEQLVVHMALGRQAGPSSASRRR